MELKHPEVTEESAKDEDIVEVSPEAMDAFVAHMRLAFDRFVSIENYKNLRINSSTLFVAIKSWHDDLYKYQKYHKIKYLNKHKLSAFLMSWIAKTKPIYLPLSQTDPLSLHPEYSKERYVTVNESFAVALGLNLLSVDTNNVDSHVVGKLIYDFYYRNVNAKQLFLTLELLAENVSLKK